MYSPYMFLVKGEPFTPPDKKTLALAFAIVAGSIATVVTAANVCGWLPQAQQSGNVVNKLDIK